MCAARVSMKNTLRSLIIRQIANSLKDCNNVEKQKLASQLRINYNSEQSCYTYLLPVKSRVCNIERYVETIKDSDLRDVFDNIQHNNNALQFDVSSRKYVKSLLDCYRNDVAPPELVEKHKNLVVEFSSPNIAKPFHLGHLRSTITGNFVANLNDYLQHRVKKINYLGDWGTQFGLVHLGVEQGNITDEQMQKNPLISLQKAYVLANERAKADPSVRDRAREIFQKLEMGDAAVYQSWSKYKEFTVDELEKTYARIGVSFDEYHWESTYNAKNTKPVLEMMEKAKLLETDEQQRKIVRLSEEISVPILKSDNSTLYILRDIAAAIDRYDKYKFDEMYYVVDNTQAKYFANLHSILTKLGLPWAKNLHHIGFGRVNGMSSRRGTAVLLGDILNEMKAAMRENQRTAANTKVDLTVEDGSADILGISAVIVNHFKHRRRKDFTFDWNQIFQEVKGDTGIRLQYSHCRLTSLEENSGASLPEACDPDLLTEDSVHSLVLSMSRFEEAVLKSFENFEPCVLTVYLFGLSNRINAALRTLTVKGQSTDLQNQRLLLFHAARNVLARGMKLLGLIPLNKM